MFNPNKLTTSDGTVITQGLAVRTNNYDEGTITGKSHRGDFGREDDLWFEVDYTKSYKGEPKTGHGDFNGERLQAL